MPPHEDQEYLGNAVSLLLNYIQKGDEDAGWERFEQLIEPSNFQDPKWAQTAEEIKQELKRVYD